MDYTTWIKNNSIQDSFFVLITSMLIDSCIREYKRRSKKRVINFIKLKPLFQNKVENSIIIKNGKVSKPIKLAKERTINL